MEQYNHKEIEKKWQERWREQGIYKTGNDPKKPKAYVLDMFPYPSGEGLHVGHPKGYIATDIYSRYKQMTGHNVLHPMGWDAFGLPAEQFAIKNKVHPRNAVLQNTTRFKEQLAKIGFNYDWEREINTTDPEYYRWTQWVFLELYKKGLAYQSYEPINWCPTCQTGLANEDLEGGKCERCGSIVEKKPMRQWVLRITDYADRMLDDLGELDWPESIKELERNWIGRSHGALIRFAVAASEKSERITEKHIEVFTTRPDTLFGATYIAISAERAAKWLEAGWHASSEVRDFILHLRKEEKEREFDFAEVVEKKGIATGMFVINPANQEAIPIWVANYVLSGYGTGAIMAVPAHDTRDFAFAKKFGLPIRMVVCPNYPEANCPVLDDAYIGAGHLVESGQFTGMTLGDAKRAITDFVGGKWTSEYRLKDWVFSRQRYWGEPIPVVHDDAPSGVKQKALLIHGFKGGANKNWLPWMKKELEQQGFEVLAPELPNPASPQLSEWLETLAPLARKLGANDIVVAHSLGSKAALHLLLGHSQPIKHLFLVASAIGEITERDWDLLEKTLGDKASVETLKEFWSVPINLKEVRAEAVSLLVADNDPVIPLKHRDGLPRDWMYRVWPGFGHFTKDEIPELLTYVLRAKNEPGVYPVDPTDLPVVLPEVESYAPTGTGESPLADIDGWVNVEGYITEAGTFKHAKQEDAPGDKETRIFRRETNTMPQWAGSSWYYLRYIDPQNSSALVDTIKEKYWSPVDMYVGGAEHATRHLIYARFWHKFLYDIGVVNHTEPFQRLQHVGLIMASDGRKMSKRYGNVVNPDDVVETFGADSLRVYEMFMGPFSQSIAWSSDNMVGARRFIERIWRMQEKLDRAIAVDKTTETLLHQTIKKVGDDIEAFGFNTAISQLMIFVNHLETLPKVPHAVFEDLLRLLAPFAPHVAEELWSMFYAQKALYHELWPVYDPEKILTETVTVAIQVNGKLRDTILVSRTLSEDEVKAIALKRPQILKWLEEKAPKKVFYIHGKIVSIVV